MKKMIARARNRRGFTVGELLISVLIMALAFGVAAAGIPAALRAMKQISETSHAQTALSVAMTVLRDELGTAQEITEISGTTIDYKDGSGQTSKIYVTDSTGTSVIMLQKFIYGSTDSYERAIVSQKARLDNLAIAYDGVSYADGVVTVEGLEVTKGDAVIADLGADNPLKIKLAGYVSAED